MQPQFTYDQLTPLEQCIIDFMSRDARNDKRLATGKRSATKLSMPEMACSGK